MGSHGALSTSGVTQPQQDEVGGAMAAMVLRKDTERPRP